MCAKFALPEFLWFAPHTRKLVKHWLVVWCSENFSDSEWHYSIIKNQSKDKKRKTKTLCKSQNYCFIQKTSFSKFGLLELSSITNFSNRFQQWWLLIMQIFTKISILRSSFGQVFFFEFLIIFRKFFKNFFSSFFMIHCSTNSPLDNLMIRLVYWGRFISSRLTFTIFWRGHVQIMLD